MNLSPQTLAWIGLSALVIGLLVRLLKSDTPLPFSIPAKWRPVAAIALGLLSGVLHALSTGTPWRDALVGGLSAGMVAIVGHDVGIESIRGGVELGAPKDPPTAGLGFLVWVGVTAFLCAHALVACAAAAEATYTGQLGQCVDHARTLDESKACRAQVDADWHIVDGGVQ